MTEETHEVVITESTAVVIDADIIAGIIMMTCDAQHGKALHAANQIIEYLIEVHESGTKIQ